MNRLPVFSLMSDSIDLTNHPRGLGLDALYGNFVLIAASKPTR
ncbi:MAG: hypothetical protein WAM53_12980 [Terrimicrobiaceae bacterium]